MKETERLQLSETKKSATAAFASATAAYKAAIDAYDNATRIYDCLLYTSDAADE